jgi:hypothetical protein
MKISQQQLSKIIKKVIQEETNEKPKKQCSQCGGELNKNDKYGVCNKCANESTNEDEEDQKESFDMYESLRAIIREELQQKSDVKKIDITITHAGDTTVYEAIIVKKDDLYEVDFNPHISNKNMLNAVIIKLAQKLNVDKKYIDVLPQTYNEQ